MQLNGLNGFKYKRQETEFSCGPASIRNCLVSLGYCHSERKIRKIAGSDKVKGTSDKQLLRTLGRLGFNTKEFYNRTESGFKQRVLRNLKKNHRIIVLTDHELHWISVISYKNKYLEVIDPNDKGLKKILTPKSLSKWCLNYDKRTSETYYYGIIIYNPEVNEAGQD